MTGVLTEHLSVVADAPAGIGVLRSLIVELAVAGRLVPQDPADEAAAQLAARLVAAKARATAEGARKQKVLEHGAATAPPFEVPAHWTWQSLDALLLITGGVTLGRKLAGQKLVALPYLRVANVQRGFLALDHLKDIEVPEDEVGKYALQAGDLLITEGGDWDKVGRTAVWQADITPCLHQNHVFRARACSDEFNPQWAALYLNSAPARSYFAGSAKQTTNLASINMTQLRSCALPLPPLAEQHRIVAKVNELMALCDRLEARQQDAEAAHAQLVQVLLDSLTQARDADEFRASWQRLAGQFHTLFATEASVDALKHAVMQAGVEGRLHQGAPRSMWRTATIDSFCTVQGGIQKTPRRAPHRLHFPYLRVANVQRGRVDVAELERYELTPEELARWRLIAGDLLVVEGNGSANEIGRCAIWRGEVADCVYQNHLMRVRPTAGDDIEYLALYLNSPVGTAHMRRLAITTSGLFNLSVGKIRSIPVELPPQEDQPRIVAKVTELLTLCDQLKARIAAANAKHSQLAAALVSQALV